MKCRKTIPIYNSQDNPSPYSYPPSMWSTNLAQGSMNSREGAGHYSNALELEQVASLALNHLQSLNFRGNHISGSVIKTFFFQFNTEKKKTSLEPHLKSVWYIHNSRRNYIFSP